MPSDIHIDPKPLHASPNVHVSARLTSMSLKTTEVKRQRTYTIGVLNLKIKNTEFEIKITSIFCRWVGALKLYRRATPAPGPDILSLAGADEDVERVRDSPPS